MAAIGKIRSWGPVLVIVIGLALFAFIAEELVRSCNSGSQAESRRVGSVLGQKIDIDDYNKIVDEYKNFKKYRTGGDENLSDNDYDQIWNDYVSNALLQNEAEELGLKVTDEEVQNVLKDGTDRTLANFGVFLNPKTGRFDANELKKFLDMYEKFTNDGTVDPSIQAQARQIGMSPAEILGIQYKYWMYCERMLRQQLLAEKYQYLLLGCCLSNPVENQMAFNDANEEASIEVASLAFSSIKDADVKVSDEELQKKYDEMKEAFRIFTPQRDIKYAMYQVVPSDADRKATKDEVQKYATELASTTDPANVVSTAKSSEHFLNIPLYKSSYPVEIAQRLDSAAVGQVVGPFENPQDNSIAAFKVVSKESLCDSVQYRMIQIGGADEAKADATADSVFNALKAGGNFSEIAKKYNQNGDSIWMNIEQSLHDSRSGKLITSIDENTKNVIEKLNTLPVGEIYNLDVTGGHLIMQVIARKNPQEKYNVAVIKRTFEFTKATRTAAYNKFSSFAADSKDGLDAMIASAKKNGYKVEDNLGITTVNHGIPLMNSMSPYGPMSIPSSREALKWVFKAKEGDVSGVMECGPNREIYLLMCLTKINDDKYLPLENKNVKEAVRAEVIRDKKADMLAAKLKDAKTIDAAKAKGAYVQTINQITFAMPAAINLDGNTPVQEPALSGAVAATKAGAFSSHVVKGNSGVYVFRVISKNKTQAKYDAFAEGVQRSMIYSQRLLNSQLIMGLLYNNAKVVDNRYLFF